MNDEKKDKKEVELQQGTERMRRQSAAHRNRKTRDVSDSDSVHSDSEERKLLQSNGRAQAIKMSKTKALKILGLTGEPVPAQIHAAAIKLLEQQDPATGGNPRKHEEISVAESFLVKEQGRILGQCKRDLDQFYRTFRDDIIQHITEKYSTLAARGRQDAQDKIAFIEKVGKDLHNLSTQFLQNISSTGRTIEDHTALNDKYYQDYHNIMSNLDAGTLDVSEQVQLRNAIEGKTFGARETQEKEQYHQSFSKDEIDRRGFYVDLQALHKHQLPFAQTQKEVAVDPISVFKEQHDHYLQDVLALGVEHPKHEALFRNLNSDLSIIGNDFLESIRNPKADIDKCSTIYAQQFSAAVKQAKANLPNNPGIWESLHPILQAIFTVVFVIKYLISLAETPENSYKMYHPEKLSVQEQWTRWQMDCMPELDLKEMRAQKSAGNK